MQSLPITDKDIPKLKNWLVDRGVEILPVTNEYEVLRFRCDAGTGVLYKGAKGFKPNSEMMYDAVAAWHDGKSWEANRKVKRARLGKTKRWLLERDGDECFYCGIPIPRPDMTIEHILSINHGGNNKLHNMALAHKKCNEMAGHLPIVDKIKLRDKLRSE